MLEPYNRQASSTCKRGWGTDERSCADTCNPSCIGERMEMAVVSLLALVAWFLLSAMQGCTQGTN